MAASGVDKPQLQQSVIPNIGIVTSYNDMLSAHRPYEPYPEVIRAAARVAGATAQVAGGVPAMCDGVTQGRAGMELSLFSRDVIALATAVALCHEAFDGALLLGICDKIVPGLFIGAASFGQMPIIFVPGGPMPSGMANKAEGRSAPALRGGPGHARRTAGGGNGLVPRRRHLHVLRHRQLQPDAHGDDGPARSGRRVRRAEHAAAPRAHGRSHAARRADHRAGR